jgi:hypothetical protein
MDKTKRGKKMNAIRGPEITKRERLCRYIFDLPAESVVMLSRYLDNLKIYELDEETIVYMKKTENTIQPTAKENLCRRILDLPAESVEKLSQYLNTLVGYKWDEEVVMRFQEKNIVLSDYKVGKNGWSVTVSNS